MLKKLLFALNFFITPFYLTAAEVLLVADFNEGNQNNLGGYFNKFERDPSNATVDLSRSVFLGKYGKSLEITATKKETGFCGAWMHFFDFRSQDKEYFDATPYTYLSFWIKGALGGEKFSIKVADERLIEVEDSANVGSIEQFIPGGVTRKWQEVLIPLKNIVSIDKTRLGGLTFDFNFQGNYTVYIDNIALKKSKDSILETESELTDIDKSDRASQQQHRTIPTRTVWVWSVFEILENKNNEQKKLFVACERENIGRLWLQLPTEYQPNVDLSVDAEKVQPDDFKVSLIHEEKLKAFIREAHNRGIKVEGLDGYPEFAQKPYHFIPLAVVDAVIDYNKRVKPEERFDGVHFDNEPYLIIGWHDKERREQILKEFLELNVECQRRIDEHSDMVYGVDVPFWWNAKDTVAGGAIGDVTFNEERKPAVYFCIDFLDNIGIMNYRDTAFGVDGILTHASPILEYAETVGKDQVYVGLEVFKYKPTEVWFPLGLPRKAFREALKTDASKFSYLSRINGFRTQLIDDGVNIHVGIELPSDPDEMMQKKINETVAEIARYLGVSSNENLSARDYRKMTMFLKKEIRKNPEWESFQTANITDSERSREYPGFKAVSIMLDKTTFADESYKELKTQLASAERELINYSAYTGTAIHYLKILDEKFTNDTQ